MHKAIADYSSCAAACASDPATASIVKLTKDGFAQQCDDPVCTLKVDMCKDKMTAALKALASVTPSGDGLEGLCTAMDAAIACFGDCIEKPITFKSVNPQIQDQFEQYRRSCRDPRVKCLSKFSECASKLPDTMSSPKDFCPKLNDAVKCLGNCSAEAGADTSAIYSFIDNCKTCGDKLSNLTCSAMVETVVTSLATSSNMTCQALKDVTDCYTPTCAAQVQVRELDEAQKLCALGDKCVTASTSCGLPELKTSSAGMNKPDDFCERVSNATTCLGANAQCFGWLSGFQQVCSRPKSQCITAIAQCVALKGNSTCAGKTDTCACFKDKMNEVKNCSKLVAGADCGKEVEEASKMCMPPPSANTLSANTCTLPGDSKNCTGKGDCKLGFCVCKQDSFGRWCEQDMKGVMEERFKTQAEFSKVLGGKDFTKPNCALPLIYCPGVKIRGKASELESCLDRLACIAIPPSTIDQTDADAAADPKNARGGEAMSAIMNCLALGNVMCPSAEGKPTCQTPTQCMVTRPAISIPAKACPAPMFACKEGCQEKACNPPSVTICPANQTLCPDLLNCAADMAGCAKKGINWEGCPLGKMMCPQKRNGQPICVDSASACTALSGCDVAGQILCGFDRTNSTGARLGAFGKPICAVDCSTSLLPLDQNMKPVAVLLPAWTPGSASLTQEAVSALKKPIFRMSAAKGSCKSAVSSTAVDMPINFAVTPVADSQITDGPFKTFADKMLSPLISVQPDATVVFDEKSEGVTIEFPLLDKALQGADNVSMALCEKVLKASKVISFSDELAAANVAAAVPEPAACMKGDQVGEFTCVCKAKVKHFTTFGVAQTEDVSSNPAATPGATPTDASSGLGAGAIAGIIIGALVGIAVIVGVVVVMKGRKGTAGSQRKDNVDL